MNARPSGIEGMARRFAIAGDFLGAVPYGSGHINDTYAATYATPAGRRRYIFQRVNPEIFREPVALMENIGRITRHARQRLEAGCATDIGRRALDLVASRDGLPYAIDPDGHFWRVYHFIEGATGHDRIRSPGQARQAAMAFGAFQGLLADLPGGDLHETVRDFHHTPKRLAALRLAVEADSEGRAGEVRAEIDFALERACWAGRLIDSLADGTLPKRVVHNDTKLNNVLLDDATGEGLCVIDLDTAMTGCALFDFGDMVRSAANSAAEDESDPAAVACDMAVFRSLAEGYLATAGAFLTSAERSAMVFSCRLLALECGVRFLTDYLQGDIYFKKKRPGHNRDRCRNQFALLRSMEARAAEMEDLAGGIA